MATNVTGNISQLLEDTYSIKAKTQEKKQKEEEEEEEKTVDFFFKKKKANLFGTKVPNVNEEGKERKCKGQFSVIIPFILDFIPFTKLLEQLGLRRRPGHRWLRLVLYTQNRK